MEEFKRHLWGFWTFAKEHPILTGLALGTIIGAVTR